MMTLQLYAHSLIEELNSEIFNKSRITFLADYVI